LFIILCFFICTFIHLQYSCKGWCGHTSPADFPEVKGPKSKIWQKNAAKLTDKKISFVRLKLANLRTFSLRALIRRPSPGGKTGPPEKNWSPRICPTNRARIGVP
jgi:hypothetical protein